MSATRRSGPQRRRIGDRTGGGDITGEANRGSKGATGRAARGQQDGGAGRDRQQDGTENRTRQDSRMGQQ